MITINYLSGANRGPLSPKVLLSNPYLEGFRNLKLAFASNKTIVTLSNEKLPGIVFTCGSRLRRIVIAALLILPLINIITVLVLRKLEMTQMVKKNAVPPKGGSTGSPRPPPIKHDPKHFGLDGVYIQGSQYQANFHGHPIGAISNDMGLKMVIKQENPERAWSTTLAMLWGDINLPAEPIPHVQLPEWSQKFEPKQINRILQQKIQPKRIQNLYNSLKYDLISESVSDMDDLISKGRKLNLNLVQRSLPKDSRDKYLRSLLESKNSIIALVKNEHDQDIQPAIIDAYIEIDGSRREIPFISHTDTFLVRFPKTGCCHNVNRQSLITALQGTKILELKGILNEEMSNRSSFETKSFKKEGVKFIPIPKLEQFVDGIRT